MFEIIKEGYQSLKKKSELKRITFELQIEEAKYKSELDRKDLDLSIKQRDRAIQLMDQLEGSINNQVQDTDLASGWFIHGSKSGQMTNELHKAFLANAYVLYQTNPHARSIVRGLVKFVLGVGPTVVPKDKKNKKKLIETWKKFKKDNKFNIREKEIAMRLFRDGEVFIRIYREKGEKGDVAIRFIRSNLIAQPINSKGYEKATFGIETDPDDIEMPTAYIKTDGDGNFKERISIEDIIHLKINCDSDDKRGVTIFRVVAKRLKQYEDWLEDRIVLNKIRSAIALVKEIETGNVGAVKNIRDANLSSRFATDRNVAQTFERGTVITASKGVKYNLLSPNINATDVKDDGRAILLAIAAGIGFPEMLFTADFSNGNYSSTLVAQNPFVREIEDWQDFFVPFYQQLFEIVIQNKIDAGQLPINTDLDCDVQFPPMIAADLHLLSQAFEVLYKYRVISRKTWRLKMGLDHDVEKDNIEMEDEEDGGINPNQIPPGSFNPKNVIPSGGASPQQPGAQPTQQPGAQPVQKKFNLPIAPVNQYGAAFIEAMESKDFKLAEKIAAKIIALDD